MGKKDIVHDVHQLIEDLREYDNPAVYYSEENDETDGEPPVKNS